MPTRSEPSAIVAGSPVTFDLDAALERLSHDALIGIDTETTGLNPWKGDKIATVQMFGNDTGTVALLHVRGELPQKLIDFLHEPGRRYVCHNAVGFDGPMLNVHGVNTRQMSWYDTLVGETVITTTGRSGVSKTLEASVRRRVGVDLDKDIEHSQWMSDELTARQVEYACQDVMHLPSLMRAQVQKAIETGQESAIKLEMAIVPYVIQMTVNGMPFSTLEWSRMFEEAQVELSKTRDALHLLFPDVTNFNSPVQLRKALNSAGVELESTAAEVLEEVVQYGNDEHARLLCQAILEYRAPAQFIKTYDEDWIDNFVVDGIVHGHFWQCAADTTRFTSSRPNLQQIPRSKRRMFGWRDGLVVISTDGSQIEVRVAADVFNDPVMKRTLENDDVHSAVGATVYGLSVDEVSANKDLRRRAKALTFTLIFGGSHRALFANARQGGAKITMTEAKADMDAFFSKYRGFYAAKLSAERSAKRAGPVVITLPTGHRRVLVGDKKKPTTILNTMVQGTAAGAMKHALLEIGRRGLDKYLAAMVHDEYVAPWVPDVEVNDYRRELEDAMLTGLGRVIHVTLKVESKVERYWKS